jgi:multiple sugar transport system permease protein
VSGPASIRRARRRSRAFSYASLSVLAVLFLLPPYYMLVTSFKTPHEIQTLPGFPLLINEGITLANYRKLFLETQFLRFFRNSAIVTGLVVAVSMAISVPAAYALSRMRFPGSGALASGVFLSYLVPETLLFIPLFKLLSGLGLLNTLWALVLVFPTLSVPFCTWILIGYFGSIPRELDEAAFIDGASHLQMLLRVFVPVAMPGIVAATIFSFTVSWAGFLYPLAFIFNPENAVLTTGVVGSLITGDVIYWGGLMAGALVAALPPVVVYVLLMDYYISGLTAGATKG